MFLASRRVLALTLFAAISCGRRAQPASDGGAAAVEKIDDKKAGCAEPDACLDDTTLLRCAGDTREKHACGEGEACVAGACVKTSLAAKALLSDRDLASSNRMALSDRGFLNAFSARTSLDKGQVDALVSALEAREAPRDLDKLPPMQPLCARDSLVTAPKTTKALEPFTMLSAAIVSPRAGAFELWTSVAGRALVFVNGKKIGIVEGDADATPLEDETKSKMNLEAGANSIVVVVEQTANDRAPALRMRVTGPNHAPLRGFEIASAIDACGAGDVARASASFVPIRGGFSAKIDVDFAGAVPRAPGDVPYALTLGEGSNAIDVSKGALAFKDVLRGEAEIAAELKPKEPGQSTLRLSLGGGAARDFPFTYRGDLHERVLALADALRAIDLAKFASGSRDSIEAHVEMLKELLATSDPDLGFLEQRLVDAEALLKSFAAGEDPYAKKRNVVWRAYRSPLDGKLQPYLAYVPTTYKPGRAMPLVVAMHGLNGEPGQALRTVVGDAPDKDKMNSLYEERHIPPQPNDGAFLVAPYAYGNAGPRPPGEEDVLRVVAEMKAAYTIDPRAISITGYSLGGTVAFTVPLHFPDVFSASAPLCGYPNFAQWSGIRDVPHTPWEEIGIKQRSIVHYAENGLHVPMNIVHGGQDGPERSQLMADRYRDLGYARVFDVQDDLDHDVWEYGYDKGRMIDWLRMHERPETPKRVRVVSGEPRYSKAYWLEILAAHDLAEFASLDATWDERKKSVSVATKNVEAFAVDTRELRGVERFEIDGASVERCGEESIFLSKKGDAFACSKDAPDMTGMKRKGVAGPLDDIDHHAAIVVYGTRANEAVNLLVAEAHARVDHTSLVFPIVRDDAISEEDIAKHSLILVGGPRDNRVTELFAKSLPVAFEDSAIVLRGERYSGDDVGVSFIAPNPRNPDEYVVVHAGVTAEGTLESRFLPVVVPDFLVYDARIVKRKKTLLLGDRKALAGGFFDASWR